MRPAAKTLSRTAVFIAVIVANGRSVELSARPVDAPGRASAQIVAPLTVTRQTDLEFGSIISSSESGTVTVSPSGATVTGGGSRSICCKTSQAARFSVDGEAGRAYTISVPTSVVARGNVASTSSAGAPDLVVDNLSVRTDSRPSQGSSGVLDSAGRDWFGIGGTLHVPGHVPPADYKATVPVTVIYG